MERIVKPTLLIDKARCVRNIQLMANKALRNGIDFRPHFKTHQSAEIAQWFRDAGVTLCTVSSVSMAQYFGENGWADITIAFPVNLREIDQINALANNTWLNLLVESKESADFLRRNISAPIGIFIDIDVGYGRTGIQPDDHKTIGSILEILDRIDNLIFKGFLTHAGHSYLARSKEEVKRIYETSVKSFIELRSHYSSQYPDLILSYGDTPTASVVEDLSAIDELRPGNFVYYDLTQWQISSCSLSDIAVAVECPVVSIHPEKNELVLYGGGVHFSKDQLEMASGQIIYGIPVHPEGKGWSNPIPESFLVKISQEHGTVSMPSAELNKFTVGDTVRILPVHSCMTANLLKDQYVII